MQALDSESDTDLSELSDDDISIGSLNSDDSESDLILSMTPAELAENETFGSEYTGPCLPVSQAARLLILMGHASTCPCRHRSKKHKDVCISTKYLMLHVRDCPGTTSTLDVCPFPWCRKVKHLLYHLVSCDDPDQCAICSPKDLSEGMGGLIGLNARRLKRYRDSMIAASKAAAIRSSVITVPKNGAVTKSEEPDNSRRLIPVAPAPMTQTPIAVSTKIAANSTLTQHGSLLAAKSECLSNISVSSMPNAQTPVPAMEATIRVHEAQTPAVLPIQTLQVPPSQEALPATPPSTSAQGAPPPPEIVNPASVAPGTSACQTLLLPESSGAAPSQILSAAPASVPTTAPVEEGNTRTDQLSATNSNPVHVPVAAALPTEAVAASVGPSSTAGTVMYSVEASGVSPLTAPAADVLMPPLLERAHVSNSTCVTGAIPTPVDDGKLQGLIGAAPQFSVELQGHSTLDAGRNEDCEDVKPSLVEEGSSATMLQESRVKLETLDSSPDMLAVEAQLATGGGHGLPPNGLPRHAVDNLKTEARAENEDPAVALSATDAPAEAGPYNGNIDDSWAGQSAAMSATDMGGGVVGGVASPPVKASDYDRAPAASASNLSLHSGANAAGAATPTAAMAAAAATASSVVCCPPPAVPTFVRSVVDGSAAATAPSTNDACPAPSSPVVASRTAPADAEQTAGPVKVN